ncbi:hypothetical protein [Lelliottia amnigena]|nr:hypothetical protein [Lelliottia amnigena]QXB21293.1 hypothetical protein I6L76_19325 [Lelliottia amnigena]
MMIGAMGDFFSFEVGFVFGGALTPGHGTIAVPGCHLPVACHNGTTDRRF